MCSLAISTQVFITTVLDIGGEGYIIFNNLLSRDGGHIYTQIFNSIDNENVQILPIIFHEQNE